MDKTAVAPEGYYTLENGDRMKAGDIIFRYNRWDELAPQCENNIVSDNTYQIARKIENMELTDLQKQIKQQQLSISSLRVKETELLLKDADLKGFHIGAKLTNGGVVKLRVVINHKMDLGGYGEAVRNYWNAHEIAFMAVTFEDKNGYKFNAPIHNLKVQESPVLPRLYGYDGKYTKDSRYVEYGCANIDIGMLRQLHSMMVTSQYGNRTIAGVTLDSGKVLTYPDVKAIMTHIDHIQQNS